MFSSTHNKTCIYDKLASENTCLKRNLYHMSYIICVLRCVIIYSTSIGITLLSSKWKETLLAFCLSYLSLNRTKCRFNKCQIFVGLIKIFVGIVWLVHKDSKSWSLSYFFDNLVNNCH